MTARHYLALGLGILVSIAVAIVSVFAFIVGAVLAGLAIVALRLHKPSMPELHPDDMIDITEDVREV
ncbi:hypothetical protein V5T82_01910 [Magnetovibrio sp. PR-2]|uniref:hypothetical protein n=1 Tax=Magnetovibrio sp. PR-2 TaxID=3120356 RepID=UPI002FCE32CA